VISYVDRKTDENKLLNHVNIGSNVISDELHSYNKLKSFYKHEKINHSRNEYIRDGDIHTDTIEGFWATLKRSVYVIH